MMKADTFQTRRDEARDAKQKLLDRFRTLANDPALEQRRAERHVVVEARESRMREKAAEAARVAAARDAEERRVAAERAAEEQRVAEELEAKRLADEAARLAARPKAINASKYALAARVIADLRQERKAS